MQPIGNRIATPYAQTERQTQTAPELPKAKETEKPSAAATDVVAVESTVITRPDYDLTHMTPDEVTTMSASLYAEGKIDIHQMVRLHSVSLQQQHPTNIEGIYTDANANNEPFNLLAKVEQRQQESPLMNQSKPLMEILLGLQNSLEVENYKALDVRA